MIEERLLFASVVHESQLRPTDADGLELRLDHISLPSHIPCPYLLTPRSHDPSLIHHLLSLSPPFLDLEYSPDLPYVSSSSTKIILSYHNFHEIPSDLDSLYSAMIRYPASIYKIAAMPQSTNDALRLLLFGRKHPNLTVICMGEIGQFGRVLGPVVGNPIDYAAVDATVAAPGQLTVDELLNTYHYRSLSPKTALYGLIGNPVAQSVGHLYHNQRFAQKNQDAVYVKMIVQESELQTFLQLAKDIGFQGLSVTMPLKEKVLPFLDEISPDAKEMGAVNTIRFEKGRFIGINTDGMGALDAIEKRMAVKGKKMLLLGAGGAARAIAFEAKKRGAEVWIHNRTEEKARALNYHVGIPSHFDVAINCSSNPLSIPLESKPLVMDIVYSPRETRFLKHASQAGCSIIYGEEMFLNQAAAQSDFWLN